MQYDEHKILIKLSLALQKKQLQITDRHISCPNVPVTIKMKSPFNETSHVKGARERPLEKSSYHNSKDTEVSS